MKRRRTRTVDDGGPNQYKGDGIVPVVESSRGRGKAWSDQAQDS